MKTPTVNQKEIIDYNSNLVVLAKPGSGKTFTIAEKIKDILPKLLEFEGVIAISYTNKASDELKSRVVGTGIDVKQSFFGTISSFYIGEIIYKFIDKVLGYNQVDLEITSKNEGITEVNELLEKYEKNQLIVEFDQFLLDYKSLYEMGLLPIEFVDEIALYILKNVESCKKYLTAKYKHVFIDEYQDCGYIQNKLFVYLIELGLIGVAVGDKDQAIFQFANKDSKYLLSLAEREDVKLFNLDKNFRCHDSIRDYSTRLLDNITTVDTLDKRVVRLKVDGDETRIGNFIDSATSVFIEKGLIENLSDIAILTKSERTGGIVYESLQTESVFYKKTPLDENSTIWGMIFKRLLIALQGKNTYIFRFVSEYFDLENEERLFSKMLYNISEISLGRDTSTVIKDFISVAETIEPNHFSQTAIDSLKSVLEDDVYLQSYSPPDKNMIQIMTLHKSKGLEFKIVFHLDVHKYILPYEDFKTGECPQFDESRNLHYVGITRASDYCILVTSTRRTNRYFRNVAGEASMLFGFNDLNKYSIPWREFYKAKLE